MMLFNYIFNIFFIKWRFIMLIEYENIIDKCCFNIVVMIVNIIQSIIYNTMFIIIYTGLIYFLY